MSALVARFGLNERQAAFLKIYLKDGRPGPSALAAGYAHEHDGYRILATPNVIAAVHAEVQRQLVVDDAPASLRVLRRIRDDDTAPARVRADIGLKMLALGGHVIKADKGNAPGKQLSEMTQSELLAYIEKNQAELDRIESELAARAKDVSAQDSAQTLPIVDAKPLPFLD
jgi:hypothetical protein